MDSLKRIVNLIFSVDIDNKTRKRKVVDARMAYSKILRDIEFTYEYIGETLDKDHATIIHYVKSIDSLLRYDLVFKNKFILAKKNFLKQNEQSIIELKEDIYTTAIRFENKLEDILSKRNQILCDLDNYEKENGASECVDYCRKLISPLFDS